jgi:hypothetical protein
MIIKTACKKTKRGTAKEIRGNNGDERNERGEFYYEKKMKEGK